MAHSRHTAKPELVLGTNTTPTEPAIPQRRRASLKNGLESVLASARVRRNEAVKKMDSGQRLSLPKEEIQFKDDTRRRSLSEPCTEPMKWISNGPPQSYVLQTCTEATAHSATSRTDINDIFGIQTQEHTAKIATNVTPYPVYEFQGQLQVYVPLLPCSATFMPKMPETTSYPIFAFWPSDTKVAAKLYGVECSSTKRPQSTRTVPRYGRSCAIGQLAKDAGSASRSRVSIQASETVLTLPQTGAPQIDLNEPFAARQRRLSIPEAAMRIISLETPKNLDYEYELLSKIKRAMKEDCQRFVREVRRAFES